MSSCERDGPSRSVLRGLVLGRVFYVPSFKISARCLPPVRCFTNSDGAVERVRLNTVGGCWPMHRSSDDDIRAWGASTAVDSDEEDERQERFGTEVLEQRRLLHSGSTPHAARERHSVGSAAWANALYQRRAVRKGAQDRRALLVVCCVLLGLGFGYTLAGRQPTAPSSPSPPAPQWQRAGSGPNAAARAEAQLQPEAAARSAAPRLGPPPTIDPARWKHVLNESLQWADTSVPAFECSDDDVTLTYWYRWRLFHLHMRRGDKLSACSSPRLGCWVRTASPATRWSRGCNPVYARLQSRAVKAATPCSQGCNPVCAPGAHRVPPQGLLVRAAQHHRGARGPSHHGGALAARRQHHR